MSSTANNSFVREVEVFGSHTMTVEADLAVVSFSVSHRDKNPDKATTSVLKTADQINQTLSKRKIVNVKSSKARLRRQTERVKGEDDRYKHKTYFIASVQFTVTTSDLDSVTPIHVDVVNAGVTDIDDTKYATSELKSLRKTAREKAIEAAVEKARLYCEGAGAKLGPPIKLVDLNPDALERRPMAHDTRSQMMKLEALEELESDGAAPELISVSGSVSAVFEILP